MVLVDSSVWIDYSNGRITPQTAYLDDCLGREAVLAADLIVAEVLQGFRHQRDFERMKRLFATLDRIDIAGFEIAIRAAHNFRHLRSRGVTVRKTIDCLIAARCVADGLRLLYSDRDFDPFVEHLGLLQA